MLSNKCEISTLINFQNQLFLPHKIFPSAFMKEQKEQKEPFMFFEDL